MMAPGDHSSHGARHQTTEEPRDYVFIDTPALLDEWVASMRTAIDSGVTARCCIDTEADSLHHYQEKLCLIQISFDGRHALVDPLALADMSPLIGALDQCEIWIHGSDYDLTMLRRTYNWAPKEVRDTQIAARLVGYRQFGLAALLESVFGASHSKASQKADWSRRPLPPTMLRYAVDDVRLLLQLADHLMAKLKDAGRIDWFLQGCRALQDDVAGRTSAGKEDPWRVQGSGRLHPKGLALLKAFWEWREQAAGGRDIPCFRVMSNKQMLDYAVNYEAQQNIMPPNGWRPRWKKDFDHILDELATSDPATWPQRIRKNNGRMSEEDRQAVERLCQFRDTQAAALGIEGSLLGSRSTLEQVVIDPDGTRHLLPWQREVLSEGLQRIVRKT